MDRKFRCEWCVGDELMMQYHDEVWGVPVYDDRQLFATLKVECVADRAARGAVRHRPISYTIEK